MAKVPSVNKAAAFLPPLLLGPMKVPSDVKCRKWRPIKDVVVPNTTNKPFVPCVTEAFTILAIGVIDQCHCCLEVPVGTGFFPDEILKKIFAAILIEWLITVRALC